MFSDIHPPDACPFEPMTFARFSEKGAFQAKDAVQAVLLEFSDVFHAAFAGGLKEALNAELGLERAFGAAGGLLLGARPVFAARSAFP